jgi:hypothetical protein
VWDLRLYLVLTSLVLVSIASGDDRNDLSGRVIERCCLRMCDSIIAQFESDLDSALTNTINTTDPAYLAESHSFDIMLISDKLLSDSRISLRRVSNRARNKDNLAKSYECDVLNEFEASNHPWKEKVIWNHCSDKFQFHYFKPIRVNASCLLCHGAEAEVPKPVKTNLRDLYRNDRAFDYQVGDLMGMYVVSIAIPKDHDSLHQFIVHTDR